ISGFREANVIGSQTYGGGGALGGCLSVLTRSGEFSILLVTCRCFRGLHGVSCGRGVSSSEEGKVAVAPEFTVIARRLGIVSAAGTVFLVVVYAITLIAGLVSLQSQQQPIGDPLFSILEILIILMMPFMVALMVAVHAWASPETKTFSLMALVFMGLLAGLTCSLHFVILTVSHQAAFAGQSWLALLEFKWPSVAYALPVLALDRL